jgi:superfamily II DNA/RNA helicase
LPGAEPSARAAKQLATLYAAVTRDRVHNGLIRLLVGILPTGSGKSFIAYLLPRLLDILYGREDTPMRCYICVPLKA